MYLVRLITVIREARVIHKSPLIPSSLIPSSLILNKYLALLLHNLPCFTRNQSLEYQVQHFSLLPVKKGLFHFFWLCRRKLRRAAAVKSVWGNFG